MSSFNGRIIELPGVVVDHFVSGNLKLGKLFFLSHCHKDHMEGLTAPNFCTVLQNRNTHLYCSEVTRALLRCDPDCKALVPYLKSLPMEEPVTLPLPGSTGGTLSVVLLPAGHCPGSAMFLFQQGKCNVLYTGDFRLSVDDLQRLPALHCGKRSDISVSDTVLSTSPEFVSQSSIPPMSGLWKMVDGTRYGTKLDTVDKTNQMVLDLDSLYIDTTFCHPNVASLPSRETSRDVILLLMEDWLAKSTRHVVQLDCSCFGFEHIFLGVYQKFNMKVHVNQWRYQAYHEIPAVLGCLTANGGDTRVHACRANKGSKYGKGLPCGAHGNGFTGDHPHVLRIKPSTQWFARHSAKFDQIKIYIVEFHFWRVLHSMHASFSEIREFVKYLRPKSVVPCVVTPWDLNAMDVTRRMKDLVQHSSPCKRTNTVQHVSHSSTAKKPCYSDDDIEPTLENEHDLRPSDVSKATLPCLMTNSPEGKKLSLSLSPIRSPLRPQKCITSSDEHNQTSLELSLSEGNSGNHSDRLQHSEVQKASSDSNDSHTVSTSRKINKSTQTSDEVIDLTQSSVLSSDSDVTFVDDNFELGSQDSSKSWFPPTPEAKLSVKTIAFEDI